MAADRSQDRPTVCLLLSGTGPATPPTGVAVAPAVQRHGHGWRRLSDLQGVSRCDRDLPRETQVVPGDRCLVLASAGLLLLTPHEPVAYGGHAALEQGA